jgi:hypothetical protein
MRHPPSVGTVKHHGHEEIPRHPPLQGLLHHGRNTRFVLCFCAFILDKPMYNFDFLPSVLYKKIYDIGMLYTWPTSHCDLCS